MKMEKQEKDINKEYEKSQRKIAKIRTKYVKKVLDLRREAFNIAMEMRRKLFEAGANYSEIEEAINEYRGCLDSCLTINHEVDENTICSETVSEMIKQEAENHN